MKKLSKELNLEFINTVKAVMDFIKVEDTDSIKDFGALSVGLLKACGEGADEGDLNQLYFICQKHKLFINYIC